MKIHLSQIPEEGVEHQINWPVSSLPRLVELCGPQQGNLEARVFLRNHEGSVSVHGEVRLSVLAPCQRCLDPVPLLVDERVDLRLSPAEDYNQGNSEAHLGTGDLELSYYEGEEIDLAHLLEDEVLLSLPETVTETDEEGRCLVCSRSMEDLFDAERDDPEAHPFARMRQWVEKE